MNTSFVTSCKCLCTHFYHMTTIKKSLNFLLRIKEHKNRLPDHVFFYRLCFEDSYSGAFVKPPLFSIALVKTCKGLILTGKNY